MTWLRRNAESIEAVAAAITALAAVAALAGISLQLNANDALSRAQSARECYAAHLALATAHPQFAAPQDACALRASDRGGAYAAFVDHLLYAAEQMLAAEDGWEPTFLDLVSRHAGYICAPDGPRGDTDAVYRLLADFRALQCAGVPACAP